MMTIDDYLEKMLTGGGAIYMVMDSENAMIGRIEKTGEKEFWT